MPLHKVSVSPMENSITSAPYQGQSPVKVSQSRYSADRCSSQTSSLSSNGFDICRICHCEGDTEVPLIAPCYCSGSLRYVHQACLQQWIKSSNIRCCELCKFQFIMQTKTKPFTEWEHLEMSGMERRKLLCAVLFHAVALTCVIWSLYVLIDRAVDEIRMGSLEWLFWTKLIVVAIGFTGGVVFMYIQCKAYLHICQRWKAYNRVIYVQNAPEKPSLTLPQIPVKPSSTTDSHIVHMGQQEHPSHICSSAAPSYAEPVNRSDMRANEKRSIDLKGVRNLHIFFNDENRIRVQKDEKQSRLVDYLESGEPSAVESGAVIPQQRSEHENVNSGSLGTSWHIQIEKTTNGKELPKNNENRVLEEAGPSESPEPRQYTDDYKVTCNDNSESPVLKLQIKKAEIVIKFGGTNETESNVNENREIGNERADSSVNIKINGDTEKGERPSLDVSPNTEPKTIRDSQQLDDEGSEDSLSNCGSATCRLLPEPEPTCYNSSNVRPKSYPFDKRQSLHSGTWTPSAENTAALDQDVGSKSPLLAQKKYSEANKSN